MGVPSGGDGVGLGRVGAGLIGDAVGLGSVGVGMDGDGVAGAGVVEGVGGACAEQAARINEAHTRIRGITCFVNIAFSWRGI